MVYSDTIPQYNLNSVRKKNWSWYEVHSKWNVNNIHDRIAEGQESAYSLHPTLFVFSIVGGSGL